MNDRILLISNSTMHGSGFLDHCMPEIKDFLGQTREIAFLPFALFNRKEYAEKARKRFAAASYSLTAILDSLDANQILAGTEAIFVGGGNTFRLLKTLYDFDLLSPIAARVREGIPYIGSSAGSIVAGPSIKTTKDMPIVQPPSFDALNLVPFQISPHYLDPNPDSTHMGETQEERIMQFLEENDAPVVGLREGAMLRIENGSVRLRGSTGARIFRRREEAREVLPGEALEDLLVKKHAARSKR